ncbi:hypothetical protein FJ937_01970 [Mesorhizobium sp. B2-4-4]|nr:hypothetical protein FJ937_01970 [Mesorhizobium sp. B2-4-4]
MNSSQMEKYIWASILYYAVVAVSLIFFVLFVSDLGTLWLFLCFFGYLALILCLRAWRLRRHPQSAYQVGLTKRRLNNCP